MNERLGYVIATVLHPDYGHVVHVLQGTYAERPEVLESLVKREVLLTACFPLDAARRRKFVRVIGEVPLGETMPWSPVFRTRLNMKLGDDWSLWDGHTQTYFGALTEQQAREIPVLQVVNVGLIVEVLRTETVPARPNISRLRDS